MFDIKMAILHWIILGKNTHKVGGCKIVIEKGVGVMNWYFMHLMLYRMSSIYVSIQLTSIYFVSTMILPCLQSPRMFSSPTQTRLELGLIIWRNSKTHIEPQRATSVLIKT